MNTFIFVKFLTMLLMPPASLAVGTILGLLLIAFGWWRLGWAAILAAAASTPSSCWAAAWRPRCRPSASFRA